MSGYHRDGVESDPEGAEESAFNENDEPVDNEYYNFLHVPRNASNEEIGAAYKRLTRLYHPDKHLDEDKKKKADLMFNKLNQIYQVLNDPKKRAIYDCLGEKGLEERGWELIQRTKTPSEIREEYERIAKERAERRLQQRTNPTSRLRMTINATDLFERYLYDEEYDDVIDSGLPTLEISEISFAQTIDCPITNADNVVISGNVTTANGNGDGSVGCAWRRALSNGSSLETNLQIGSHSHMGGKYSRKIASRTFAVFSGTLQLTGRGIKPEFELSFAHQFSKETFGYLSYSSKWQMFETEDAFVLEQDQHGMATTLVRNSQNYRLQSSLHLGIPHTYLSLGVTRKFETEDQCRLRGRVQFGTFGAILEYGVEKRISSHCHLGATMTLGVPIGITLKIKMTRAQQTYLFPVHLSDEILMQPLFYGTITPLLAWFTFKKLVLDPYEARKKRQEMEELARANRSRVAESRREAEASVYLMRERFNRIRAEEEAKNGLVVILALYGKISDSLDILEELEDVVDGALRDYHGISETLATKLIRSYPEIIDVTIPVQCLVEDNSRISLYEGNKYELAGFYDPCPLDDEKSLLLRYLYQGRVHQVVISDNEPVKLPKNGHRLSNVPLSQSGHSLSS